MKIVFVLTIALLIIINITTNINAHVVHGVNMRNLGGPFREVSHTVKDDLHTTVYVSPPIVLEAGEVANTDPDKTILNFPNFPIAIKSYRAEVVDEFNVSVPLYEAYNHHWIVFMNGGQGNIGECDSLRYVFGVGAESRNTITRFPDPYRFFTQGTEVWTANIHFIRTVNVPYVKQCVECHCGDINNPYSGGSIHCCPDRSFCPTDDGPYPPPKTYHLQYTVEWNYPSADLVPVQIYVFDAADCAIEFQIPPCESNATQCVASRSKSYTFAQDTWAVYGQGHVHNGAINITLTNQATGQVICAGVPRYGNSTEAGNEKNYLVEISTCTWDTPLFLPAGTTITYTGYYHSQPYHDGVMSLFYLGVIKKN